MVPFDFSTPAFPNDPVLSQLRLFANRSILTRVENGKIVPLTDSFYDVSTVPTLRQG